MAWASSLIQSMYEGTAVNSVKQGVSDSAQFDVKVGVHQGSVLSSLLFIFILEALSTKFRISLLFERCKCIHTAPAFRRQVAGNRAETVCANSPSFYCAPAECTLESF